MQVTIFVKRKFILLKEEKWFTSEIGENCDTNNGSRSTSSAVVENILSKK